MVGNMVGWLRTVTFITLRTVVLVHPGSSHYGLYIQLAYWQPWLCILLMTTEQLDSTFLTSALDLHQEIKLK